MNHLSLFSGIGGIDIAAEWAGFKTVAFVEKDKFCQQVLNKHWEGVPVIEDVKSVSIELLAQYNIQPGTIRLVTGGFPCQPFSSAGKRKGHDDDRFLWPEYLRIIRLARPAWVCAENVRGLLSMDMPDEMGTQVPETVLARIRQDLEEAGYKSEVYVFPASAVGAPHRRYRVFIVAYSLAHASSKGFQGPDNRDNNINLQRHKETFSRQSWDTTPAVLRRGHGLPNWVDRIRALGNAVVPQQVYPLLQAIADYELAVRG